MNLLRRLSRLTASYWRRKHHVTRGEAEELSDLALWHFGATDEEIIAQRRYLIEDEGDAERW